MSDLISKQASKWENTTETIDGEMTEEEWETMNDDY